MQPELLRIRPATLDDKDAVIANQVASQNAEASFHPSRQSGEAIEGTAWSMIHARHGTILVAEYDGAIIGHVGGAHAHDPSPFFLPEWQHYALIFDLYVQPAFRRHKVGLTLVKEMEARLKEAGAKTIRIIALSGNDAAQKLYAEAGFAPYEITMEKCV